MEKDVELFRNDELSLTNENFGENLNYDRYEEEIAHLEAFPSDYILAVLADLAYKDSITMPEGLEDWEVLTYASNKDITNAYRGVAFFNPKMCHVVIAHRGTDPKNPDTRIGALINDAMLAIKLFKLPQAKSAASFAYLVAEEVKRINEDREDYEKCPFRLTITGHSLGAWLAQYTTFTVKYLTLNEDKTEFIRDDKYLLNIHPHTVVFESPGCREVFEQLIEKLVYRHTSRKYGNYNTLDMTVYLNSPNMVNCIKRQIGTLYMLPISGHSIEDTIKYLAGDNAKKDVVLDMTSGIGASILQGYKWIIGSQVHRTLEKIPAKDHRCSLNVFSESEMEFLTNWDCVDSYNSSSIKNFRDKYDIPKFTLKREYNLLKGKDFKKVILIVKNLQPDRQIIFKMLQDDVGHQVRFNLFKNDVISFEKKLLDVKMVKNGYYFEDKYDLVSFFKSDKIILHVRVDVNSSLDYEFETNIIHNIIMYYKNGEIEPSFDISRKRIAFIDWNKLSKFIKESPNIIKKNYDLLVVEYCYEDDNEKVLQFLQNISIQVIILTTNMVSFKNSVDNLTEVSGFGGTLTFGDFKVESRKQFLNRKIFQLNQLQISFNDLVKNNITNRNENLMKSFPIGSALELIVADESNTIVLDCHYSNLLKPVLFYDLYDEIDCKNELHNLENSRVFVLPEDKTKVDLSKVLPNVKDLVDIKRNEEYEQQCLDNIAQTNYLITTKNGKIFLTSIFNYNFYIRRSIIHKRSVSPDIFKNINDVRDYYFFYGDRKMYNKKSRSQQVDCFQFALSEDEAIEAAESSESNGHVLKINEDGTIDWRRSYGNVNSLQKYMQSKEVPIQECDIVNDDHIIIISGEPGIGKSSVIEYLYLTLQNKYWIFPIQLKNCSFDGISEDLTYDEVAKFIMKNCSFETESIQHILSFCLQYESELPIYLMLDSFDGIVNEFIRGKIIRVINFLKHNPNVKILITTRPHLSEQLENEISVFASHFKELNDETEIVTFLVNFWRSHSCLFDRDIDEHHLQSVAENMLKSAQNTIGENATSFIKIPMNMRLLAVIVTPKSFRTSQFSDILSLYVKYVKERCDIYFKRFSLDPHPPVKKWLIESILGRISALSINLLLNVDIQQIDEEEMEEFYKVGLVYLDCKNLNYKFMHDSVSDYFISDSIKQWLTSQMYILFVEYDVGKFLITELFLNEELKKVRLFLNLHLKSISITPNRIKLCKDKLAEICQDNDSVLFNEEKESIFHICIRENLIYLLNYFLIPLLDSSNAKKILAESNFILQTPLYYAISNTSIHDNPNHSLNSLRILLNFLNNLEPKTEDVKEILLAAVYNNFISDENLDKMNEYIKNFKTLETIMNEINKKIPLIKKYLNACKKNDSKRLAQIWTKLDNDEMTKTYLLKSTNEFNETGIHLTSDVNIAEILIRPFNIDLQDHHGMTPLCRSIKEKRVDVAKLLIEKGASYVISDNFGGTPVIHAAKYNLIDIVEMLLPPEGNALVDVNVPNKFNITPLMIAARDGNEEIVTYLIQQNADIHLRDGNGLTAFYHAVKSKHAHIAEILRTAGSDINSQDKYGTTPVFYSVKHKNFDMILYLLSKGADVNIGNLREEYPLQRLMKENMIYARNKEHDRYIKMFLSGEFTARAQIHMLSEEQKWYIEKLEEEG